MTRFDIWEGHGIVVSVSNMEADKSGYNELLIDMGFKYIGYHRHIRSSDPKNNMFRLGDYLKFDIISKLRRIDHGTEIIFKQWRSKRLQRTKGLVAVKLGSSSKIKIEDLKRVRCQCGKKFNKNMDISWYELKAPWVYICCSNHKCEIMLYIKANSVDGMHDMLVVDKHTIQSIYEENYEKTV